MLSMEAYQALLFMIAVLAHIGFVVWAVETLWIPAYKQPEALLIMNLFRTSIALIVLTLMIIVVCGLLLESAGCWRCGDTMLDVFIGLFKVLLACLVLRWFLPQPKAKDVEGLSGAKKATAVESFNMAISIWYYLYVLWVSFLWFDGLGL